MCGGRRVCAAALAVAAFIYAGFCLSAGPGRTADDGETGTILFSGRDVWRNGIFGYSGLLIAPGGFEQDGLMLKLLMSGGVYRYDADSLGGQTVIGAQWLTQVLPGFRIKRGNAEMKFFFGPEWRRNRLWPDDPGNRLRGHHVGLRFGGELWHEPTPAMLIAGDASISSIDSNLSARLAVGWRMADDIFDGKGFYVGPETQYFGAGDYRHGRIGIHITSLKTDDTEWSAATGLARDSDGNASLYVKLNLSQRLAN